MTDSRLVLPARFDRPFFIASYSASHRRLVLRSRPTPSGEDEVDVVFDDVLAMKLKSSYRTLSITASLGNSEIKSFLEIPERR
jgi:hypothetical protein